MMAAASSDFATCRQALQAFFDGYPNVRLKADAERVLQALEDAGLSLPGKAAGWAAGIVYAVGCRICGVPGIFNREMEEAFGVSMNTVYRRAAAVRRAVPSAWPS